MSKGYGAAGRGVGGVCIWTKADMESAGKKGLEKGFGGQVVRMLNASLKSEVLFYVPLVGSCEGFYSKEQWGRAQ